MSAVPSLLHHNQGIRFKVNAMTFCQLAKRHSIFFLFGSNKGGDVASPASGLDESLHDRTCLDSHLARDDFGDILALFIDRKLQVLVSVWNIYR